MKEINAEYSIVSRGTEKYINHGYMVISEPKSSFRYIFNIDHGVKKSIINDECLKFKSDYEITNIAFSRFQLITALMYKKHKKEINGNILITGLGNIGISCLFYLLDENYNNITIYVRNITKYMMYLISIIEKNYNSKVNIITSLGSFDFYDTIIDTTGSSCILKTIFENVNYNKTIIILSTPRDETYSISPLIINRKNLVIIGGHELNGIDRKYRNRLFRKILKANRNKLYLKDIVSIYKFSEKKLERIKDKKNNFIEILKY